MGLFVKLLGILDLFAVIMILLSQWVPSQWVLYGAYWLILKGGFFLLTSKNIISLFDVLCGFYIVLMSWGFSWGFLNILVLLFLLQKIAFSLFL